MTAELEAKNQNPEQDIKKMFNELLCAVSCFKNFFDRERGRQKSRAIKKLVDEYKIFTKPDLR